MSRKPPESPPKKNKNLIVAVYSDHAVHHGVFYTRPQDCLADYHLFDRSYDGLLSIYLYLYNLYSTYRLPHRYSFFFLSFLSLFLANP